MSTSFPLMKYFIYFSRPYTTLPPLKMLTWHWKFYCTRALLQIPRWSIKPSFYESKGSFVLNRVEYLIIYMYTASSCSYRCICRIQVLQYKFITTVIFKFS
jgi:hypothetical protein